MTDSVLPQPLPASLADAREEAIRVLTDRYADSSLSTGEFEQRLDRLYGTQTVQAARALVADLQVARPLARPATAPATAPPMPRPAADDWGARPDEVYSLFGQRNHVARPHHAARLSVRAIFSAVTLDLRELPPGAVRDVEVRSFFSDVRVLLSTDAEVETHVNPVLGNVTDETVMPWQEQGTTHVRLRGLAVFSEVSLRRAPVGLPLALRFQEAWREAGRAVRRARKAIRARGAP